MLEKFKEAYFRELFAFANLRKARRRAREACSSLRYVGFRTGAGREAKRPRPCRTVAASSAPAARSHQRARASRLEQHRLHEEQDDGRYGAHQIAQVSEIVLSAGDEIDGRTVDMIWGNFRINREPVCRPAAERL